MESRPPESRRRFLRHSAGLATALAAGLLPSRSRAAGAFSHASAAFEVSDRSALVWVRGTGAGQRVSLAVSASSAPEKVLSLDPAELTETHDLIHVFDVTGLAPDTEYLARPALAPGGTDGNGASCRFRTMPASPRAMSFVVSADTLAIRKPFRLFDAMLERKPEFFVHLGDTMYADRPKQGTTATTLPQYRLKHAEVRADPHMQRFMASVPTFAIWDDHEVADNFDRDHPLIDVGRQAFREWWPVRTDDPRRLHRRFSWGPLADFFMLDTRQYRSSWRMSADDPAKTMLGAAQKDWLLQELRASGAPFKILLSPSPFNGSTALDSWAGFKAERAQIDHDIAEQKLQRVLVLSGDWHMAMDLSRRGTSLDEVVVGPIAAWPQFEMNPRNRSVVARSGLPHVGDAYNFGHVRIEPSGGGARLTLDIVDDKGAVRFSKTLES
jgi:alkaline phosphatase D